MVNIDTHHDSNWILSLGARSLVSHMNAGDILEIEYVNAELILFVCVLSVTILLDIHAESLRSLPSKPSLEIVFHFAFLPHLFYLKPHLITFHLDHFRRAY